MHRRRAESRRAAAVAFTLALAVPSVAWSLAGSAAADSDGDAARRAAAEIQAARDRANAAAAAWTEAGIELENLSEETDELEAEFEQLQAEVEALNSQVVEVAVNRYMTGGAGAVTIFEGPQATTNQLVASELVARATNSSTESLDDYAAAKVDLEEKREELEASRRALERKRQEHVAAQKAAEAEVKKLQEIEAQRLEDERVRKILEAQRAEELRQQQAAAEAQAQAQSQADAQPDAQPQVQTQSQSQSQRPVAPAPSGSENASANSTLPTTESSGDKPPDTKPAETSPPQTAPPQTSPPRSGMICPVRGAGYSDTWGASRSGGRSHQGVDMMASSGTPIYAVVGGGVHFKQTRLGGNSAWLTGNDGNKYFYAHLSKFEGSGRSVSQGDVIGYVGSTGNAGTPHLHFEVHPGGGAAVNPYSYVRQAGC